jgi:retron-type reverse transcriptase
VSPVLANLFMHYAFDSWLEREFPAVEFERYADLCRARQNSAYAEDRIMPSVALSVLVSGG